MDVHLRDLRYFAAVAEELNFTQAAQRLFISQPALSKQIRTLESQLGFPLFERRARGVVLTPQGKSLLPAAREILERWEKSYADTRALARPETVVVGMQTAVGRDLQGSAMRRFREQAPGCTVTLRLVSWEDPTAGLAEGSSDVAFVWLPLTEPRISVHVLADEPRWVALAADHPLATSATPIAFTDLLDEPFIALPESAGPLRDFWLASAERGGHPMRIGAAAAAADEVFEAVASGLGITLLAEGNAALYQRPGIVCRPVDGLSPARLALAWRTGDDRPMVKLFVSCVIDR